MANTPEITLLSRARILLTIVAMHTRTTHAAIALWAGLTMAAGCGADVLVDGDGAGGSGATGTGTGTGHTGGNTTVTTSTSTGVGGSTGECVGYEDEPGLAPVGLRFINESGQPIFLAAHCGVVRYDLRAAGESELEYGFDPFCLQTCEALQTEGPFACDDCMPSSVVLLPGAELVVEWDGTGLLETHMPESCFALPSALTSCWQILAAQPGDYQVSVIGYASCSDECSCNDEGLCNGSATGSPAYADPTVFNFPTAAIHDVVFGVCAFGCPEGAS